jgi:hypothetical protein
VDIHSLPGPLYIRAGALGAFLSSKQSRTAVVLGTRSADILVRYSHGVSMEYMILFLVFRVGFAAEGSSIYEFTLWRLLGGLGKR